MKATPMVSDMAANISYESLVKKETNDIIIPENNITEKNMFFI
jgi:hypothetical protein